MANSAERSGALVDVDVDVAVVGAGVVGLAVARALGRAGREVVLLEAADRAGTGASSRNSEVVHAGLYYRPGSRKARACVAGRRLLYDYCRRRGVPHSVCGKLVVAVDDEQVGRLRALGRRARENGVEGVRWLERGEVAALEPELRCLAALHSTTTGVLDSHSLLRALQADAEEAGVSMLFGAEVRRARPVGDGLVVEVGGRVEDAFVARHLVNCAGIAAVPLARRVEGRAAHLVPEPHLCKGNYFALRGRPPFRRLVYPMPDADGLGVHLTLDLAGRARFGPDAEWLPATGSPSFDVDPSRGEAFESRIRRYWPGLPDGALEPAFAGLRARIHGPGQEPADFLVLGPDEHGQRGVTHLFGIESPGLTAALALAEEVAGRFARSSA